MYAFVVFLGLALGLAVVMQVLDELVPVKVPDAFARSFAVLVAVGFAWAVDYSVFSAFGQALREQWMHPWLTGLALVGGGEFVRSLVATLGHRAGEPPVELVPRMRTAA